MPDTFTSGQEFRAQLARLIDAATKAKIHPTLIGNILEDAAESIRMSYATSAPIMWRRSRSINFADFPPNRDNTMPIPVHITRKPVQPTPREGERRDVQASSGFELLQTSHGAPRVRDDGRASVGRLRRPIGLAAARRTKSMTCARIAQDRRLIDSAGRAFPRALLMLCSQFPVACRLRPFRSPSVGIVQLRSATHRECVRAAGMAAADADAGSTRPLLPIDTSTCRRIPSRATLFVVSVLDSPAHMTQDQTRAQRPNTYDPSVLSGEEKQRFLAALGDGFGYLHRNQYLDEAALPREVEAGLLTHRAYHSKDDPPKYWDHD
jgi:hypothetical protein